MIRKELERKVIDIVSKYTLYVVTMDSNIYDDLGIYSLSEADIKEDVNEEFRLDIHWSIWSRFWHTKPTISELCDFIEREL